ncbi:MAG: DUF559 domain-containing protein [Solirubrobacteraceae bacterium]|nr:DUF559 domain-containing protein [Solirubrobacteraceae bacterium]
MDFDALRTRQHGTFSIWQLRRAGWSRKRATHATRGLREVHHGVYVTGDAPLTAMQRAWAAVLTEPGTRLSHTSLSRLAEFDDWRSDVETVTRHGNGGPIHLPGLTVYRSSFLPPASLATFDGLPCLSPARTVLDLVPDRSDRNARRLVRNALRVHALTGRDLHVGVAVHARRPGIVRLRAYTRDYAHLPIGRTRSDAEALGLAILDGAGVPIPLVNRKWEGEEADYAWPAARWIIELDGGQWHHPLDDARKQAVWERAGWTVKRLPTDDVYHRPERLLALRPPFNVTSAPL